MDETCSCGGCQTNIDNKEGIQRWVDTALNKVGEMQESHSLETMKDEVAFLGNALRNINFLLGKDNESCDCRREGN
jgi:hypothetical protein